MNIYEIFDIMTGDILLNEGEIARCDSKDTVYYGRCPHCGKSWFVLTKQQYDAWCDGVLSFKHCCGKELKREEFKEVGE